MLWVMLEIERYFKMNMNRLNSMSLQMLVKIDELEIR